MPDDDELNAMAEYEKKQRLRAFGIPRKWIEDANAKPSMGDPYASWRNAQAAQATSTFQRRVAEAAFWYLDKREPRLVKALLRDVSISERERFDAGDLEYRLTWTEPLTRMEYVASRVVSRQDVEAFRFAVNGNLFDDVGESLMEQILRANSTRMLDLYLGVQSASLGSLLPTGTRARPAKDAPAAPVTPRVRRLRVGEE